ncbi:MAG: glycosyltransferase family 39 protein [Anaerolineae bacterium]|nr:glycosyltransferase family 39 protein [Anaerolineae bacterium]
MSPRFDLRRRVAALRIDPYLCLVILFSLFAVLPLAGPQYFFDAHDARNTVFFLTEFDAALRDGVWYPGWATDQALGYGYPTFVLIPPLAYYVAEGFHLLGATKVAAVKWTFALATIGAGLAMYLYARHVMGRRRGFLAAIVYVYVPYHLVDIYVRAALAEYCAFVWMPLALLAFHQLARRPSARQMGLAALALGALWLTHNPTGLTFTLLLAAYVLYRLLVAPVPWAQRLRRAMASLGGAILGLGLAATLLLPNLFERSYINQEQWVRAGYDYALHFLQPADLFSPAWGYAPGTPGAEGVMSFQLGAVALILATVATLSAFRRPAHERSLSLFFAVASLLVVFFMLPLSAPLWDQLTIAALLQFPWRLLALTSVTLAILCGFSAGALRDAAADSLAGDLQAARVHAPTLILGLVAILASFPYTLPQYTATPASAEGPLLSIEFELEYEDMRGMTAWSDVMPPDSPLVAQYLAGESLTTAEALAPGATVEMIRAGGASDELWVRSETGTALLFYTYYFPGWRVYVDGQRLPDEALQPAPPYGLLTVDIPPGEHRVLLRWGDTPLRMAAKAITLTSLLLALVLVALPRLSFVASRGRLS